MPDGSGWIPVTIVGGYAVFSTHEWGIIDASLLIMGHWQKYRIWIVGGYAMALYHNPYYTWHYTIFYPAI